MADEQRPSIHERVAAHQEAKASTEPVEVAAQLTDVWRDEWAFRVTCPVPHCSRHQDFRLPSAKEGEPLPVPPALQCSCGQRIKAKID